MPRRSRSPPQSGSLAADTLRREHMSNQPTDETTSRLRWHAGLDQPADELVPGPLIVDRTGTEGTLERLDEALADVLSTLARLNRELNGPVPSASIDGVDQISRLLAYAIAEIVRMLRERPDSTEAGWAVETAWGAVLAGDIDDLEQHLRDGGAARGR
jgi:hypothetical protein